MLLLKKKGRLVGRWELYSQAPPINSLNTMISVPLATSSLNGLCFNNASLAKFAGRMLAYRPSSLRSLRMPCSGRTGPTPHLGPPTAPKSQSRPVLLARSGRCSGRRLDEAQMVRLMMGGRLLAEVQGFKALRHSSATQTSPNCPPARKHCSHLAPFV
jgi:hypothetical protein